MYGNRPPDPKINVGKFFWDVFFPSLIASLVIAGIVEFVSVIFGSHVELKRSFPIVFIILFFMLFIFFIKNTFYKSNKVYTILRNDYNKQKNKINDDKVFLPYLKYARTDEDIKVILNNITVISRKISDVKRKLKILIDNNKLLRNNHNNIGMTDMDKNNEILYYFIDLFDLYIAIDIELYFSGLIFYLRKEDIKTIKIKSIIEKLLEDMNRYIYNNYPKDISLNQIIEYYKISGQTIKNIMETINDIKIKLIALQGKIIISNISPIEIEDELNLIISDKEYSKMSINLDDSNNEYDRYISEIEVT